MLTKLAFVSHWPAHLIARTLAPFYSYASRFRPVLEASEPLISRDALAQVGTGAETILLAEDEPAVRSLIRKILQRSGYVVLEACHGTEAIQVAEQHASVIDLLVTDVVMPLISGPQLAQQLALLRPAMKVLYISGYMDNTISCHGLLDAGAIFLQKPFTPDELVRKVRAVLEAG
jgi:CheY-like chemotaxis protein